MKTKSIITLLVVFIAGGFLGAFIAGRTFNKRIDHIKENRNPEVFKARFHRELETTDEQKVVIDSIMASYLPRIKEQRHQHRSEMRALHGQMMEEVKKELNEEQLKNLERVRNRLMHKDHPPRDHHHRRE